MVRAVRLTVRDYAHGTGAEGVNAIESAELSEDSPRANTGVAEGLARLVLRELAERMSAHEGLEVFAAHRSKFEGWLKVELAAILRERFRSVVPEKNRVDLVTDDWAFEVKVADASYRHPRAVPKSRPITESVRSVVEDAWKLRGLSGCKHKAVIFAALPMPGRSLEAWRAHLSKIRRELRELYSLSFRFRNGVPGAVYFGLV